MKAKVLIYPDVQEKGRLVVKVEEKKPELPSMGYGLIKHDPLQIAIDVSRLPEQDDPGAKFTAYTLKSSGKRVNIGGDVEVIYSCGGSAVLDGGYFPSVQELKLS